MSGKIIDGKKIAQEIRDEIRKEVESLDVKPGLVVVRVGDDPASKVYVGMKEKAAKEIGYESKIIVLDVKTKEKELLELIDDLNHDPCIHGILVQLPLPKHINEHKIIMAIDPKKDVDGFHPVNVGNLFIGRKGLVPCTPLGVIELLKRSGINLNGLNACVIGRSNIVGKPMALLLLQEHCTVTTCHSRTKSICAMSKDADLIVAAVGVPKLLTADMVKEGVIVIDVGMNRTDEGLVGDVDYEHVKKKASHITPVPGGVGPMTVAMLMKNTLTAYQKLEGDKCGK